MTHPSQLSINNYTYPLPDHRIARFPLTPRDASKLLFYNHGNLSTHQYLNLPELITPGTLLTFNNTKVVEARLIFQKPTGGIIEVFCLEPDNQYPDITTAMSQKNKVWWKCLVGGASKWKPGQVLEKTFTHEGGQYSLQARMQEKLPDCFILELSWQPSDWSFAEILHKAGIIPIPPYLKRDTETSDATTYQTTYAKIDGSVAAPTAGLHFTPELLQSLQQKNIQESFVTLHVGAGTFKPVKSERMQDHYMHAEFFEVDSATIKQLLASYPNIIAVGTTSVRTLESLYWMGVKLYLHPALSIEELEMTQWEVYDELATYAIPVEQSLQNLLQWMNKNNANRILSKTQILIAPGYTMRIIKGLITNFHQPQSTLLLLVAALIGEGWKNVYTYALENDFRFLSYGDGCLLIP